MGNIYSSFSTSDYDSILDKINNKKDFILINTLPENNQECLIITTIPANKYNQLKKLGFVNVYIYFGGLFEWLLLREIYGNTNFKIIGNTNDILKYK